MILIRSSLFFALFSLSVALFSIPMALAARLKSFDTACRLANAWGMLNLWLLKHLCGLDYEIHGWEKLPSQNCIIMAKHQSTWETMSLRGLLPHQQTWVLKEELLRVPFFGMALRSCEPIAIDRDAGREAARLLVQQGKVALAKGRWIIIFPEGTRVAPGEQKKYGLGGALLAEQSGYPIVPIAHNAGVFWRRRDIRKYPGTIQVIIGDPIPTAGRRASAITREVEAWIEARVAELPQARDV